MAPVQHYQKTNELTYEMWKQRNWIFLLLLGVIGHAPHVPRDRRLTHFSLIEFASYWMCQIRSGSKSFERVFRLDSCKALPTLLFFLVRKIFSIS
jgi:hypothetical protein